MGLQEGERQRGETGADREVAARDPASVTSQRERQSKKAKVQCLTQQWLSVVQECTFGVLIKE